MTDFAYQGNIRCLFLPAVSDIDAPTEAEIDAGTDLGDVIAEFSGFSTKANRIPVPRASSTFVPTIGGTQTAEDSSLTIYLDNASQTIRDLFPLRAEGWLVFSDYKPTGDLDAGDLVDVFPVSVIGRPKLRVLGDTAARWTLEVAITDVPSEDVAIVA